MGVNLQLRKRADRDAEPDADGRHPLKHVELVGDAPATHAFRYAWLEAGEAEGWVETSASQVVLHLADGDLTYQITGRWASGNGVDVELDQPSKKRKA